MARRYFAGEDPIGKVVRNPHGKGEVVGIVGDVKHYGLDSEPRAELFMPAWQQPLNGMALIVRTASDPKGFVDAIRREVLAIDAEQPIYDVSAMVDVVSRSVFLPRISMLLLGAFAVSALLLAVVGIYGVVSYTVTRADARARRADGARRRRRDARCGWCSAGACCWSPAGTRVRPGRVVRRDARDRRPALRRQPARSARVRRACRLLLAAAGFVASADPRAPGDAGRSDRRAARGINRKHVQRRVRRVRRDSPVIQITRWRSGGSCGVRL